MPGDQRRGRGRRRGDGLRAPVPWGRVVAAVVVTVVVAVLACVGAGPVRTPSASAGTDHAVDAAHTAHVVHPAHAKITGSEPADGSTVERAPDAVTLAVDAKPATVEGDPLQVYGPGGRRLDDAHISLADEGRRISVGMNPTLDRPAGRYEIVYRIVSADTHLIAGRLEFTTLAPVPATAALLPQGAGAGAGATGTSADEDDSGLGRLLHGWPEQAWPPLIAAVALLLAGGRVMWRRHRSPDRTGYGRTP